MTKLNLSILIDDQIFRKQIVGGISNYFLALLDEFKNSSRVQVKLGVVFYKTVKMSEYFGTVFREYRGKVFIFPAIALNSFKMLALRYELVHSTFYSRWSIALLGSKPHIVTIHDMIPEDYPEYFYQGNPNKYKNKYIKDADGIIAVSDYTYKRLLHHYPTINCPVTVIPLASNFRLDDFQSVDLRSKFDRKTLLYVGPRGSHKNFETVIESLSRLIPLIKNISLICVGGGVFTPKEMRKFSLLGIESQINQVECSDPGLRTLYLETSLCVCSSIAEGFGLPSVEAASMFSPVIVGKNSFLGERLPESLVLSDVRDSLEMADKIFMILSDYPTFEASAKSALQSVSDLSWSNTAEMTVDFYLSVHKMSRNRRLFGQSIVPKSDP